MSEDRADLYRALAEALAEPPGWLAHAGCDWPLTRAAAQLALTSDAADEAARSLAQIPAEPLSARRKRYISLFMGSGRPRFWLYESLFCNGRFLDPSTATIEKLYLACGLQTIGAELPDHASMELAFLAHLAKRQAAEPQRERNWQRLERLFIRQHAGRWLPKLGRSLANTNDKVYAPIGRLLTRWLQEAKQSSRQQKAGASTWPQIQQSSACTLCGFCVQVCPTQALSIHESALETILYLTIPTCTGCRKCERICDTNAMVMNSAKNDVVNPNKLVALRRSPRACCPRCGQATISRAEMDYVASQIGSPAWLPYCLSCRGDLMENAL